jgi:hypothetical protein
LLNQNAPLALTLSLLISALLRAGAPALAQSSRVRVTPQTICIGAFYGGATVRVEGATGQGNQVIIMVRSANATQAFKQARRFGPIWFNAGKVTVSGVPSLWLVFSSVPVADCLPRAVIDQYALDRPAIQKQMRIDCPPPACTQVADDYLAYKASQGSYRLVSGAFRLAPPGPPGASSPSYRLEFELPRCAAPGQYQIRVLECRGGEVVATSEIPLHVAQVGLPARISWLASQHASSYGVLSILLALAAGLGIDFLAAHCFERRAAGH